MNRKCSQILTLLLIAFVCLPPILVAQEPNFQWSFNGRPDDPSLVCVQINEPSEPPRFNWDDNFLCSDRDWGLQWSFNGEIDGMLCTRINEPSEPPRFNWDDNFLCVPLGSPLLLEWSFAGPVEHSGFDCLQINEPSEAPRFDWDDNFLCFAGDSGGDALPDAWEVSGLDVDGDGTIDVDLPALGAHPQRKDIFVEIDCLVNDGNGNGILTDPQDHSHCPTTIAIGNVVAAFANAPVPNSDGTVGVQLHVDTGPLDAAGRVNLVTSDGGVTGSFGDLRDAMPGGLIGGGDRRW